MSVSFTASDRQTLIRLASTLPKGSEERKALLASLKTAHIDDRTLDQLVDMAVESVGGDPTNSDFTPALKGARDKWHNAVEDALEKWLEKPKNFAKLDLDSSVFRGVEDQEDIDMVVEALQEHRGGAGYLYFMEMEGHGVGTWDGDWDQLFVDGDRTVSELSKYMERTVSREHQNLKNEIDEIAFASVPEDEDGYEDDTYKNNRWAARGALIRLASSLPKGSPERRVILGGLTMSDMRKAMRKVEKVFGRLKDAYGKAQDKYDDIYEHREYAAYTDPKEYPHFEHDREKVMELGAKFLADTRRANQETLTAIREFRDGIDEADVEASGSEAKRLYKNLEKDLKEVEAKIKTQPRDWEEMGKAIEWGTGPRLFHAVGPTLSRLVEALTGERL